MTFVSHVVLMKPRADLSAADREAGSAFERAVREIPSIRGVRVGRRMMHAAAGEQPDAADYIAMLDFDGELSVKDEEELARVNVPVTDLAGASGH